MNLTAKQITHLGLRDIAHLLEEMRNHLPRRPTREPSGRFGPPSASAVNESEAMKISKSTSSA